MLGVHRGFDLHPVVEWLLQLLEPPVGALNVNIQGNPPNGTPKSVSVTVKMSVEEFSTVRLA